MKTNQKGIDLIKKFEGCRLVPYRDAVGIWTVGYGHTGLKDMGPITQERAEQLLLEDLQKVEDALSKLIHVPVNRNQFSALVSLVYNIGVSNFKVSYMLDRLNARNYAATANHFLLWDRAGGRELEGLHARREAERELFLDPYDV